MKTKYTFDFLIFDSLQNTGKSLNILKTHLEYNPATFVSLANPKHKTIIKNLVSEMYENYKKSQLAKSMGYSWNRWN